MKKIFILLFVSLALFSCEKEENNKIFEYQLLPSDCLLYTSDAADE